MKLFTKRISAILVIAALLLSIMPAALAAQAFNLILQGGNSLSVTARGDTIAFSLTATDVQYEDRTPDQLEVVFQNGTGTSLSDVFTGSITGTTLAGGLTLTLTVKNNKAALVGTGTVIVREKTSTENVSNASDVIDINVPAAATMDIVGDVSHDFGTFLRKSDGSYTVAPSAYKFVIKNNGAETLTNINMVSVQSTAGAFTVSPADGALGTLASGASLEISVTPNQNMVTSVTPYTIGFALDGQTTAGQAIAAPDATFTVSDASTAKDILTFTHTNILGDATINSTTSPYTIAATVSSTTDLTTFAPAITVSPNATVIPAPGAATNFSGGPVNYTVTAQDGSTKVYAVTIAKSTLSSAKNITNFAVTGSMGTPTITDTSDTAGTISVTMPAGTDLTTLAPTFTIPNAASVDHTSGTSRNFEGSVTTPVEYTVTAEDGSKKIYKVTITNATGSSVKDITGFTITNIVGNAVINSTTSPYTITAVVKYGTILTSLTPEFTLSSLASISPASGTAQNFTNPVVYTVTAQDGTTKQYTVTVTAQDANSAKSLDSFSINGYTGAIVGTTVTVDMPYGTTVSSLIPTYSYTGASINLTSGQAVNFTNPVTVRVTANDGSFIDYTVTVNVRSASSDKQITNFTIPNMVGNAVINHTARTITVTMPAGTSVTSLTPTITTSFGATVSPASLVAQNFTNPIVYTVKATDGSTTTYTVTVVLEGSTTLTHAGTGVKVSGNLNSNATLNVTENSLHASGTCTACDHIRAWMAQGSVLKVYNIEITGGYTGYVTVTMPVSNSYSGRQLTVVHCNNGTLERTNSTVDTSGNISASFSSVSPFAVLNGLYSGLPGDGADPPKTGGDLTYFSWGALLVTLALLMAAVFGMYLLNQKRKRLG